MAYLGASGRIAGSVASSWAVPYGASGGLGSSGAFGSSGGASGASGQTDGGGTTGPSGKSGPSGEIWGGRLEGEGT
jgi:hypothetical protein